LFDFCFADHIPRSTVGSDEFVSDGEHDRPDDGGALTPLRDPAIDAKGLALRPAPASNRRSAVMALERLPQPMYDLFWRADRGEAHVQNAEWH